MLKEEYKNIIAFHPGYYLIDILEDLEMTQEDFAKRLGTSGKTVSLLLRGQTPLTNDLALKISAMFGLSVDTLLNLQKTYDEKKIEIDRQKVIDAQIEIADMIDYSYFVKNGILPKVKDKFEKVRQLCSFLKVSDMRILTQRDLLASFRTTVTNVADKNIVNANVWMQTALNLGANLQVDPFDEAKLHAAIPEIRAMTVKRPDEFLPRLGDIFCSCGVAFVLLPALKNCGVNGVVKWFDDRVVLAINDRFSYADAFWFSLFHEIKHVLQRKKTKTIVSLDKSQTDCDIALEEEADRFATDTLINTKEYHRYFDTLGRYISRDNIVRFAELQGIHPGIVVGRLQHDHKVPHSHFADLREKYRIEM